MSIFRQHIGSLKRKKELDKNAKVVKRRRNLASGKSKGNNIIKKKNKIDDLKGYGKLKNAKTVSDE